MTKDKLTDLLKLKRKSQVEIAPKYEMSKASFNNKIRSSETRFDLKDLIKLANSKDNKLAFIDENDKPVIVFDMEDLNEATEK